MKKILIIRFSALGDIAMTIPVVYDLAVQYPDLDITMLSREMARPLFERMLTDKALRRARKSRKEEVKRF